MVSPYEELAGFSFGDATTFQPETGTLVSSEYLHIHIHYFQPVIKSWTLLRTICDVKCLLPTVSISVHCSQAKACGFLRDLVPSLRHTACFLSRPAAGCLQNNLSELRPGFFPSTILKLNPLLLPRFSTPAAHLHGLRSFKSQVAVHSS